MDYPILNACESLCNFNSGGMAFDGGTCLHQVNSIKITKKAVNKAKDISKKVKKIKSNVNKKRTKAKKEVKTVSNK